VKSEAERLAIQWGLPVAIMLVAVAVRLFFSADKLTMIGITRGLVIGLFVGAMVNLALSDVVWLGDGARGARGALVGVAVVLAEDLIVALLSLGRQIRKHPEQLIELLLRGKK